MYSEELTSVAKAYIIIAEFIYGLKPVPFNGSGF
jgi:hypothetical protein